MPSHFNLFLAEVKDFTPIYFKVIFSPLQITLPPTFAPQNVLEIQTLLSCFIPPPIDRFIHRL